MPPVNVSPLAVMSNHAVPPSGLPSTFETVVAAKVRFCFFAMSSTTAGLDVMPACENESGTTICAASLSLVGRYEHDERGRSVLNPVEGSWGSADVTPSVGPDLQFC